MGSSKFINQEI